MPRDPLDILEAMKDESATLARNGAAMAPARVDEYRGELELSLAEYTRWLDEQTVVARSARTLAHWRTRFPELLELNMARWVGKGRRARRQYRACVVPRPANQASVEAEAREAARQVKAG